jgi:hypothetical protein
MAHAEYKPEVTMMVEEEGNEVSCVTHASESVPLKYLWDARPRLGSVRLRRLYGLAREHTPARSVVCSLLCLLNAASSSDQL